MKICPGRCLAVCASVVASSAQVSAAWAQSTVGNATLTPSPSSINEPYGVTSPFSTHQRLGNTTGIGGSTLDTESVTAESRTAPGRYVRGPAATEPAALRLQLPSAMPSATSAASPALSQPSFDYSVNTITPHTDLSVPTFRTQPFFGNTGSNRNPALDQLHYGQSLRF